MPITEISSWTGTIVGIMSGIGIIAGVVRYFNNKNTEISQLYDAVTKVTRQNEQLRDTLSASHSHSVTSAFDDLKNKSEALATSLGADYYSVLVGMPLETPQALRIIHATGSAAKAVTGKEFPCDQGISGWAFTHQESSWVNKLAQDPKHYHKMDSATGSHSGEDAALAVPVPLKGQGAPRGVLMFFKHGENPFREQDVVIAEKAVPGIRRILTEIDENYYQDVPTVERGEILEQCVVFCDIRRFSEVAKIVRLQNLVSLLNEFYSRLLPHTFKADGELVKLLGDGMYLRFQLSSVTMSALSALNAAKDMHREFEKLLKNWQKFGHPVSEQNALCIGIATGGTYSGMLGPPNARMEEMVGASVNLSSHLCDHAKTMGGGIVLCPRTAALLEGSGTPFEPVYTSDGPAHRVVPG